MNDSLLWADVGHRIAPPLPAVETPRSPLQQRRRRGFQPEVDDGREAVQLVRDDGVLRWVYQPPQQQQQRRRAWRAIGVDRRDVVQRFEYPPLGRNQITSALVALDLELNPQRGLRRWRDGGWQPVAADELAALQGRVLLLVHGTFSESRMFDAELGETAAGRDLFARLTDASGAYAAVLAFDHATLSVAPWLNALALKTALEPLRARLDVVCHSRGGLVVSWALKLAPLPVDQVVFVGTPLMGTSLAAPNRLRDALDLLANVADAMSQLARGTALAFPPAMPLALGAAGLAKVLGRVLNLGAALPLADAVVGLVPGLMSQSRVDNNLELAQLFPLPTQARLSGIGVTFKPDEVNQPLWKFWNRFTHIGDQLKYAGADLIFRQPNDLVVDTASMNQLGPGVLIPAIDWRDLGERAQTHHCSYFRDADALAFLDERLR
jgi:pimeloyl-ACP methyl ester carboxylesterase